MKFRTRCVHVGNEKDPQTGAVVPPIYCASTFVQPGAGDFGEFDYSRTGNPTRRNLETYIANLENGVGALAFSSGMAATHCALMALRSGDHVVAGTDIYGGTYRLLHQVCHKSGVEVSLADSTRLENLERVIRPETRMLWLESPGNPLMSISDIRACAQWGKSKGLLVGIDNTLATPVLTKPLDLGVDIVQHSATKYLGGHSDALGGILVFSDQKLFDEMHFLQNATGAVMSPWDAFLISRGIKTLELRVRQHCENAKQVADFLQGHPSVKTVYYPGLDSHPGKSIAESQMNGRFGG
ncbi:MAG: PLP-dependent transferase, partial [Planctomycetota bacterium]|nr:PLP-dependent transferase [Planctomycetota bacterium]